MTIPVNEDFFALMDAGVVAGGYASRSDFTRHAIAEFLSDLGIEVPSRLVAAAQRTGKGYASRHQKAHVADAECVAAILPHDAGGELQVPDVSKVAEISPAPGYSEMNDAPVAEIYQVGTPVRRSKSRIPSGVKAPKKGK